MSKKKTHDEYVVELAIKNPTVKVVGQYIDAKTPIAHYCTIHNITWDIAPTNALQGQGCKECGIMKVRYKTKKTDEQYKKELADVNPNIIVLGKYINAQTPILHQCNLDGCVWEAIPNNVLRGHGCPMCFGNKKKTTEEYKKELIDINPNIEVIEEYVDAKTPILHICKIDGYKWKASPDSILRGTGCLKCGNKNKADALRKTHEEYVTDVLKVNPNIEVIGQYINAQTPILHRCKKDKCEWMARPYNILNGYGCPACQESKGEKTIKQWLESHKIKYIPQKRFDDCKDIKILPFDFYLLDYNICIEYDGQQHYEPVDFAGKGLEHAQQKFIKTQYHDEIKNIYCKNNNIPLLRIPYFANIEEELNNFLFI